MQVRIIIRGFSVTAWLSRSFSDEELEDSSVGLLESVLNRFSGGEYCVDQHQQKCNDQAS